MPNPMNVYFKRGTQSALDTLITNNTNGQSNVFKAGAFYLTEDTNRLYFAQATNKLVELNQFIHIVPAHESLPDITTNPNLKSGDFYYWTDNNILAVYTGNGTTNGWIQINPDTRLKQSTSAITTADGGDITLNKVSITTTIEEAGKNAGNTATGSFTLKGGENVHLKLNANNEIVIRADNDHSTVYILSTAANENNRNEGHLQLSSQGGDSVDDITFVGGGGTQISSDANGNINIRSHSDIDSIINNFNSQGTLTTKIDFQGNESAINSVGITPVITYGSTSTTLESKTFIPENANSDPTAHLNVYSISEIDALFDEKEAEFDGMKFKGVITSLTDAANKIGSNTNKPGYTYKAGLDIQLTKPDTEEILVSAKKGDLIIAEAGPNDTIVWKVIDSGNDQFIQAVGNIENKALTLEDHEHSDASIAKISFSEDSNNANAKINIVATGTGTNNTQMNFQLLHGAPGTGVAKTYAPATVENGREQTKKGELVIPTISSISLDAQGHIAGVTTVEYKVKDTHPTLLDLTYSSTVNENVGKYGANFALSDQVGGGINLNLNLTSDNLKLYKVTPSSESAPDNTLKVNLEWESFT